MTNTPYIAFTGELKGVFHELYKENDRDILRVHCIMLSSPMDSTHKRIVARWNILTIFEWWAHNTFVGNGKPGAWLHTHHIDGLVQKRHNSSALAMELHLSCTNPSTCSWWLEEKTSGGVQSGWHAVCDSSFHYVKSNKGKRCFYYHCPGSL